MEKKSQLLYDKPAIKSNQALHTISSLAQDLGYILEPEQPHLSDEGLILMRDKKVLVGVREIDGRKAIIKASHIPAGKSEILAEKLAQDALSSAIFSQEKILFPEELYYGEVGEYLFRITAFIEQDKVFGAHDLDEQFFMLIREYEAQESFYANTFEHINIVRKVFPVRNASGYIKSMDEFRKKAIDSGEKEIASALERGLELMKENQDLIEERSNYLTHTDFVPSNFRVSGKKVYMIDLSSMHFANRHEGLARFLNYCIIHNPNLEKAVLDYVKYNRGKEELLCLRLMRIYKAGFLLNHYFKSLEKTEGNLRILTQKRIALWHNILTNFLLDTPVDPSLIENYKGKRDSLRSKEELERQKEFNLI